MADTIAELNALSTKLNRKTDQLDSLVSTINDELKKLNLGLEVWLEDPPIQVTDYVDEYGGKDDDEVVKRTREATLLGFCRIHYEWGLAVREVTWETEVPEGEVTTVNAKAPVLLLETTRFSQAKAIRLIPRLLDVLKKQAEITLAGIESAEQVAEQL